MPSHSFWSYSIDLRDCYARQLTEAEWQITALCSHNLIFLALQELPWAPPGCLTITSVRCQGFVLL